jgi:uncharacterized membrane protein YfcA
MPGVETLIVILAGYLGAGFVKGVTGLGYSTTCLAIMVTFIGLEKALPLVLIPSICSNLVVMFQAGHLVAMLKRFWLMYLLTLPSLIFGLYFFGTFGPKWPTLALGCVLFLYAAISLFAVELRLSETGERKLKGPVGILTGVINGMTGSQIIPVIIYLQALPLSRNEFIQAINISFSLSTVIMFIGLGKMGIFTVETGLISLIGLVPVYVAIHFGGIIRDKMSTEGFRRVVLTMLLLMGTNLIIRQFL